MVFQCKYCPFRSNARKVHMRHTFECHSSAPNFRYPCGISGCVQTFSTYSGISSHLGRKHLNESLELESQVTEQDEHFVPNIEQGEEELSDEELSETIADLEETNSTSANRQKSVALLLLTLKEKYRVTQTAIDFTVGQMKETIDNMLHDVKMAVEKKLNVDTSVIDECFDVNPFRGLDTEYLQSNFYQKHFNLVEPITITLGTDLVSVQKGTKRLIQEKAFTFQYVPLLNGLKGLLKKKEILDEIMQEHSRTDEYIADFCDGDLFRNHNIFQHSHQNLQLIMYFDEVEVCNPLGGHDGIHKLGMFYYVLGNIRPELRSTIRTIQLIGCVESPILSKYGFAKVMEPFIKDVNTLSSEGFSVDVEGVTHHFYGTVLLCLADTLAAHQLGGFKVGVGFSLRICRDCMATREDIQTKFVEDNFVLRDPATHDIYCSKLDGPLSAEDSVTYGVNAVSPLNAISNFHVANSQIPQDVMHVIFEGVLPLETKLLISSLISNNYITLDFLNQRISHFNYGRNEARNKPSKDFQKVNFSGTSKLRLSSAQMWNFAVYLPLMIGDRIPEDNPQWESFLLLLEITKVCTARIVSVQLRDYLKALIEDHHRLFKSCYPDVNFTPKMHYMVHFPRYLTYIGPMVSTWCMRMEAKNSYFKRVAQIGNFKNLPFTVAKRHQRLMCGYLQGKFFLYDDLEAGPCKKDSITQLCDDDVFKAVLELLPATDPQTNLVRPNWIKIYGNQYYKSDFVNVGFQQDDLPIFCKILDIFILAETIPLLQLDVYKTLGINSHLSCYQITRTTNSTVILLSQLHHKDQYYAHFSPGDSNTYIAMKSHVTNIIDKY